MVVTKYRSNNGTYFDNHYTEKYREISRRVAADTACTPFIGFLIRLSGPALAEQMGSQINAGGIHLTIDRELGKFP